MVYGESENNQLIILKAGQILKILLPSNPTTGYSWMFENKPDEEILRMVEEAYLPPAPKSYVLGGGGNQYWLFSSIAPGKTSLSLAYRRAWEKHLSPVKNYHLDIEVC